ncbi:MAG: type V CRISPR-associated protein Cas12a/Cpf1 [Campylobacterales bacterium]|nr:type V CRISPR-associated protein Cas12a/Cpf1 [Campylobacterales bacterium]
MLQNFTNQYQLSKTLRFELRPVGKTKEHIEAKGLIIQDEQRAEEYKEMKKIIDRYHKAFIEDALNGIAIEGLETYEKLYFAIKDEKGKKEFEKLQDTLRKRIVELFKKHPKWSTLFKKELIRNELLTFLDSEEIPEEQKINEKEIVLKFVDFTTYFTGFHENRANMYIDEALHTAVAYRIVHENLPVFLGNKKTFEQIATKYPELIADSKDAIESHLFGAVFEDMFTLAYFSHTLAQNHIDLYNTMIGGKVSNDGSKIQGFNEKINLYRQKHGLSKRDLPNLKPLYKQILSDRESLSWLPEAFEDKNELAEAIKTFYQNNIIAFECCDGKILVSTISI